MPANGNWAKFFACQRRAAFAPPTHPFEADKFLKDRPNRDVLLEKVTMSRATAILLLLLAAALEAGGDAIIRAGLHKNLFWQKTLLFALAGVVLFGTDGPSIHRRGSSANFSVSTRCFSL